MGTVWIYAASHPDLVKVFASIEAANRWFEEHDPERVAFEYEVLE